MTEDSRKKLLSKRVLDVKVGSGMDVLRLFDLYRDMGGFTSRYLYEAFDILSAMFGDVQSTNFLSFTADLVSTGLRGIIAQFIRTGKFKVIVTTCGTLDHDIARALGARYSEGSFDMDDSFLREHGISRLGNLLIPVEDYGLLTEKYVHGVLDRLHDIGKSWGGRELIHELGRSLPQDSNSILKASFDTGTPVYVPGFTDGAVGTHVFTYSQTRKFFLDPLKDMSELSNIIFDSKKSGALVLGGGISKHHTIWWNQFKEGLDYAVYLTTAVEYDGSLSGARTKEAISWNKIKTDARHTTVWGDATVTLPLLAAALFTKFGIKV